MNICIVGATGNVGRKILDVLDKKNFSFDQLYLLASEKSVSTTTKLLEKNDEKEISEIFKKNKYNIMNQKLFIRYI